MCLCLNVNVSLSLAARLLMSHCLRWVLVFQFCLVLIKCLFCSFTPGLCFLRLRDLCGQSVHYGQCWQCLFGAPLLIPGFFLFTFSFFFFFSNPPSILFHQEIRLQIRWQDTQEKTRSCCHVLFCSTFFLPFSFIIIWLYPLFWTDLT